MDPVRITAVVEGNGDEQAVSLLLRRLLAEWFSRYDSVVAQVDNAHGVHNILRPGGLEGLVELALRRHPTGVLVVLDADRADPVGRACALRLRLSDDDTRASVAIVCAQRGYESWLRAGLLAADAGPHPGAAPQNLCDAARRFDDTGGVTDWLTTHALGGTHYNKVDHQAALTARMDFLLAATRSRSFQRLLHAIEEILQAHDARTTIVSPTRCPEP